MGQNIVCKIYQFFLIAGKDTVVHKKKCLTQHQDFQQKMHSNKKKNYEAIDTNDLKEFNIKIGPHQKNKTLKTEDFNFFLICFFS